MTKKPAHSGRSKSRSHRQRVSSDSPYAEPIGFSRAIRVGDRVLVSGTGPVWPHGECPEDAALQARRCFEIALDALAELGGSVKDVVLTRMYFTHRDDVEAIGEVHGEVFGDVRPASTMVEALGLVDSRWRLEVELEADLSRPS